MVLPIQRKTTGRIDHLDNLFHDKDIRLSSRPSAKTSQDTAGLRSVSRHKVGPHVSRVLNADKPLENGNASIQPSTRPDVESSVIPSSLVSGRQSRRVLPLDRTNKPSVPESTPTDQATPRTTHVNVTKLPRKSTAPRASSVDPNSRAMPQEHSMAKQHSSATARRTEPTENRRARTASIGGIEVIRMAQSAADGRGTKSGIVARRAGILEKVHGK